MARSCKFYMEHQKFGRKRTNSGYAQQSTERDRSNNLCAWLQRTAQRRRRNCCGVVKFWNQRRTRIWADATQKWFDLDASDNFAGHQRSWKSQRICNTTWCQTRSMKKPNNLARRTCQRRGRFNLCLATLWNLYEFQIPAIWEIKERDKEFYACLEKARF